MPPKRKAAAEIEAPTEEIVAPAKKGKKSGSVTIEHCKSW